MPSGAKKRKAAKKKKEQEANNNTNLQGNGNRKSHDGRDSDGGEVGSPASQENQSQQHHFDKVSEESEKTDSSANTSEADKKFVEGLAPAAGESQKDDGVGKVQRGLSVEQNEQINDIRIDRDDDEKSSSSSSSSSDNDSQASEKKGKEDANQSDYGQKVVGDRPTLPMSEIVEQEMMGSQVTNPEILEAIEPGLVVNEGKSFPKIDRTTQDEDKSLPDLYVVSENTLPKSNDLGSASEAAVATEKDTNETSHLSGEKTVATTFSGDKGKLLVSSEGHPENTSSLNGNNKMLTSSDAHSAETCKDIKNPKDDKNSECTEKQPLAGSTPGVAQQTSWLSCCGLLEAFAGSK